MLSGIKFLVVDDHPYVREIISTILKAVGADTIAFAGSGSLALEMIRDGSPDIVILDVIMDDMDGLDVVKLIRQSAGSRNPYVPVIMVTGRADRASVMEARDAGVTEFVSKPVSAAKLLQRIEAVLTSPRPFVKAESYSGPCRRRRRDAAYDGPQRRSADGVLD
jgi:CheY-like chemotaxis protein